MKGLKQLFEGAIIRDILDPDLITVDDNPGDVTDSKEDDDPYEDDGQCLLSLHPGIGRAVEDCQHSHGPGMLLVIY